MEKQALSVIVTLTVAVAQKDAMAAMSGLSGQNPKLLF